MTFESLQIDSRCHRLLAARGITEPTPIQAKAIPAALTGRDLVAIAQTGTGKTLAFGLPALSRLADTPRGHTRMLVLAPTRELVHQVHGVLRPFAHAFGLTTVCVHGGVPFGAQTSALRRGASIVVACPGRLLDHIQRGNTRFDDLSILVLDEADRMLDMGFLPDIRRIQSALPGERQTMMFSATFPREIAKLADSMMSDPLRVEAGPVAQPADAVSQWICSVRRERKVDLLKQILRGSEVGPTLVFMRTKRATDRLAKVLSREGFAAEAIHGGQTQGRRTRAIEGFRSGRHRVLVATDVAARGLDVKGISHVVNYDIPSTPDDYVHRIGRTARAKASGDAITFVTPDDLSQLRDIERALKRRLETKSWNGAESTPAVATKPAVALKSFEPPRPKARRQRPRRPAKKTSGTTRRPWG